MSSIAYLDTSAFLRIFLDEPDSDQVSKALQGPTEIFALRLVLTEARVTLARLKRSGRISQEEYRQLLESVALYWETEIQCMEMDEKVFDSAEHMAEIQPGLRTLDALHVGAARVLRKDMRPEQVVFIGCDQRLVRSAATIGMQVLPELAAGPGGGAEA